MRARSVNLYGNKKGEKMRTKREKRKLEEKWRFFKFYKRFVFML